MPCKSLLEKQVKDESPVLHELWRKKNSDVEEGRAEISLSHQKFCTVFILINFYQMFVLEVVRSIDFAL